MEATATITREEERIEDSISLPSKDEFVACEQCPHRDHLGKPSGVRSYMHFWFQDGLLSFCKHHGEKNEARLEELGAILVFDNRESLIENRTQGEP